MNALLGDDLDTAFGGGKRPYRNNMSEKSAMRFVDIMRWHVLHAFHTRRHEASDNQNL
jgi:hypothetical protein